MINSLLLLKIFYWLNWQQILILQLIELRWLKKKTRQKVAGSLKIKIPTITLPTAPIPVHTA